MNQPRTREQVLELVQQRTMTNVKTLAAVLGTGSNSIYGEIKAGTWTGTRVLRIGKNILIPTADILALIEGGDAA